MRVTLRFSISQHIRDAQLMKSLNPLFGCGNYTTFPGRDHGEFRVVATSDITSKIIPFFDKYPLQGAKAKDYADFRKVVELVKNKAHLTEEGLNQIRKIKEGMNRGRSN